MMTLPRDIRLFPLTGVLLLPRGTLPLQVFEPRYLNMVSDALGAGRLIGLVQPAEPLGDPVPGDAPLSAVGCAGRIVGFEEAEHGRFRIRLLGLSRFRLLDTAGHPGGYRVGRVSYEGFGEDRSDDTGTFPGRPGLEGVIKRYCNARGIQTDWQTVREASDEALVTSFSMMCPLDPSEKQALLESEGLDARGRLLASLLELALHSPHGDDTAVRH